MKEKRERKRWKGGREREKEKDGREGGKERERKKRKEGIKKEIRERKGEREGGRERGSREGRKEKRKNKRKKRSKGMHQKSIFISNIYCKENNSLLMVFSAIILEKNCLITGCPFKNRFHLENYISIPISKHQTKSYCFRQIVIVRMAKTHECRLGFYS